MKKSLLVLSLSFITALGVGALQSNQDPANPCKKLWTQTMCSADTSGSCVWDSVETRCELIGGNQDRCANYQNQQSCESSVWSYCMWDDVNRVCQQQQQ
jgi:hypothetical protein